MWFCQGLHDLGYVEGKNILIEYRGAEGKYYWLPACIGELVALEVYIIVTAGRPASLAVKKQAPSIPLAMMAVGYLIGTGLIESLAHPGGNVTGLTAIAADLEGKRLELLREVIPKLSHVAVFWNPANTFQAYLRQQCGADRSPRISNERAVPGGAITGALDYAVSRPFAENGHVHCSYWRYCLFLHNRARIMEFATPQRLPGVSRYSGTGRSGRSDVLWAKLRGHAQARELPPLWTRF